MHKPRTVRHKATIAAAANRTKAGRSLRLFTRIRVQLLGGILFAVVMPALVRWPSSSLIPVWGLSGLQSAVLGSFLALLVGYWALRQFIDYPGVQATQYIFPVFAASYALVILGFFFLRIEYSRYQFGASFLVAIVWFYVCFFLARRTLRPTYGLVTAGDTRGLNKIDIVDWVSLKKPAHPGGVIDGIVVDLRAELSDEWSGFLAHSALKGLPVYHVKQMSEALTGKVEIENLSENSLGSVLPSLFYLKLKRLIDLGVVVVVTPVFMVIIAIAALVIKLESTGPVFFLQPRMGFRGEPFEMIKLRTMQVDIDAAGSQFTEDDDPRITRVGKYLRKFHIDELPQIVNIMAGEMSWIGPRPEAIELSRWYERDIPFYSYRHIVRPGITGWAQVNQGNVAQLEAATYKLHYDFYYIKHFSPWLDALITAKTVRTILTGFGSK